MYERLVFANDTLGWVYIFIPRNGSRSFRACGLFGSQDYPYAWKPKYEKYKKVVIIRNPIDRIISAFFYVTHSVHGKSVRSVLAEDLRKAFGVFINPLDDNISIDEHVGNRQVDFFDALEIDIENIEVVMLTERYGENLKSFKDKYNLDIETLHINKSDDAPSQILKDLVEEDEDIKNIILKYYERDFILYNKAKELVIK